MLLIVFVLGRGSLLLIVFGTWIRVAHRFFVLGRGSVLFIVYFFLGRGSVLLMFFVLGG